MTTPDYPEQSYYPSAKITLRIRLEEFVDKVLADKVPPKTTPRLKGVKDDRAPLQTMLDPDSPGRRFVLVSGTTPSPGGAGTQQGTSADNLSFDVVGIIPKKATWKQNSLSTADTLTLSIRYQDLPLDPRVLRSIAVSFYLGTVSATDFAEGINGKTRDATKSGKEPLNVVPDSYLDEQGRSRTNLRFQGWADKNKITKGAEMGVVELECVDNTRLLEKQPCPAKLVVGMQKPIDEAIAEYLSHFPQMEGLLVEYLPNTVEKDEIPKLKGVLAHSAFVPNLGPPSGGGGGSSETVLDYLTTVTKTIGHILRFDGVRLIVQRASSTLDTGPVPRVDDVYQGRTLPSGEYPVRAFVYGRNISEMTVERDFSKHEAKNVEVRSYDPERKNVNVARFPEKGDRVVTSGPGAGKADQDWIVEQIPGGIRDKKVLKEIAEEIYTARNRQQISVTMKTKNLASFGAGNADPDLLDIKFGDAFAIYENGGLQDGSLSEIEHQMRSESDCAAALIERGFEPDFAKAYAKAYTNAGFQRAFYLREMSAEWDIEAGVSFEFSGVNFIVARIGVPTTSVKDRASK